MLRYSASGVMQVTPKATMRLAGQRSASLTSTALSAVAADSPACACRT
jgi:hypothetical protein